MSNPQRYRIIEGRRAWTVWDLHSAATAHFQVATCFSASAAEELADHLNRQEA